MKKFHKTVTPPPYCFYEILIQKFDRISGTYVFLNKRYEIRLTPPPRLWIFFIKFRFFLRMASLNDKYDGDNGDFDDNDGRIWPENIQIL